MTDLGKKALEETVGYVLRYGGMCRDCGDSFGVCPNSGMPCNRDQCAAVVRHTIEAIEYGVKHGFLANPFAYVANLEARATAAEERVKEGLERAAQWHDERATFCMSRRWTKKAAMHQISAATIRAMKDGADIG